MKTKTNKKNIKEPEETLNIVEEPMGIYVTVVQNPINFRLMDLLDTTIDTSKINNQETNIIQLIRSGISKKSLDHLIQQIGYSISEIADVLHVSDRNLRRYTAKEKLNTEQSERLVEIAMLYSKGEEVFGSIESFNNWMNFDIAALGQQKPKSFLDTSLGIQLLMKELGRIEHGVFA